MCMSRCVGQRGPPQGQLCSTTIIDNSIMIANSFLSHMYIYIHAGKYKEYIERVYKWKHPTMYTLDYFHLIISLRKINNSLQNLAFLYTLAYGFLFETKKTFSALIAALSKWKHSCIFEFHRFCISHWESGFHSFLTTLKPC